MIIKTFDGTADFEACRAAEQWCRDNGISFGPMQGPEPRGLMYGDVIIFKWRTLPVETIARLDGTMTGDMRHGPITIKIREA